MSKHHAPRPAQSKKGKPKEKPNVKVRKEPPRLLSASGSGYVQDPRYGLGATSKHTTPLENLPLGLGVDEEEVEPLEPLEPEPEAVDKDSQKWITAEARLKHETHETEGSMEQITQERAHLTAVLANYEALARRKGMDIRSDIRVVERRLLELDRKLGLDQDAA